MNIVTVTTRSSQSEKYNRVCKKYLDRFLITTIDAWNIGNLQLILINPLLSSGNFKQCYSYEGYNIQIGINGLTW